MGLFGGLLAGGDFDLSMLPVVSGAPTLAQTSPQPVASAPPGLFGGSKAGSMAKTAPSPQGFHPNILRVLNDVILGSATPADSIDAQRARANAQAQQAQYMQQVNSLGLSPEEKLIAINSPEEWMKQRATRSAFHDVAGGNTIINGPGGAMQVAPKLVDHEGVYGVQGAGGYQQTGQAGPSTGEMQTAARDASNAQHQQFDDLTRGLPEGFHPEIGPDGKPTGKWTLDQAYGEFAKEKARAGSTKISVPITLPAQNEFAKATATQYASDFSKARDDAQAAQQALGTLQNVAGSLLHANTGAFAGMAQQRDRVLSAIGDKDAVKRASDTQLLDSQLNSMVLPLVKQLGSSNSITDADREFTKQIVGTKDLTPEALNRIMAIQKRDAEAKINRFKNMGREAFNAVPPAQGLPATAFGNGAGSPSGAAKVRKYNPLTGRIE